MVSASASPLFKQKLITACFAGYDRDAEHGIGKYLIMTSTTISRQTNNITRASFKTLERLELTATLILRVGST